MFDIFVVGTSEEECNDWKGMWIAQVLAERQVPHVNGAEIMKAFVKRFDVAWHAGTVKKAAMVCHHRVNTTHVDWSSN
jgi:hypothetical protein